MKRISLLFGLLLVTAMYSAQTANDSITLDPQKQLNAAQRLLVRQLWFGSYRRCLWGNALQPARRG